MIREAGAQKVWPLTSGPLLQILSDHGVCHGPPVLLLDLRAIPPPPPFPLCFLNGVQEFLWAVVCCRGLLQLTSFMPRLHPPPCPLQRATVWPCDGTPPPMHSSPPGAAPWQSRAHGSAGASGGRATSVPQATPHSAKHTATPAKIRGPCEHHPARPLPCRCHPVHGTACSQHNEAQKSRKERDTDFQAKKGLGASIPKPARNEALSSLSAPPLSPSGNGGNNASLPPGALARGVVKW